MKEKDVEDSNKQLFEEKAKWQCEHGVGKGKYIPCGKSATRVVEWRHQDGDRTVMSALVTMAGLYAAQDAAQQLDGEELRGWPIQVRVSER